MAQQNNQPATRKGEPATMTWFMYALIAYFILNAVCSAALVGRPRPAVTAPAAAFMVLWFIGLAFGCYLTAR